MLKRLWLLLPLLVIPAAWLLLGDDLGFFLAWWLAFSVVGWLAWPLAARIFPGGDSGYLLAKPLGLALSTLLLWTLSYIKVLPFHRWSITLVLCILGLMAWLFKEGWRKLDGVWSDHRQMRRAAAGELLFGAALLFWTFARGVKPEIDGLEKFMDVGFMNTLWRTDYLPALDMWLAGGKINYYYFGQYVYTFMAKLVNIRPEVSYNLSMAATFALSFSLAYAAVSQLIALLRRIEPRLPAFAQAAGGLMAAVLTCLAGNGHSYWYDQASPGHGLLTWLNTIGLVGGYTENTFWFADATRFIGYNPNTADKTIHEFPFYSFLVADLHAHVINLAFVLLLVAVLVRLISDDRLHQAAADCRDSQEKNRLSNDREWHRAEFRQVISRFRITAQNGPLLVVTVLLAVSMMGNFWDFAIYFAVTTLVLLLVNGRGYGRIRLASLPVFIVQCVLLLVPFLTVSQPFLAVALFLLVLLANSYLTLIFGDGLTLTGAQMSWIFFLAHLLTLPFNSSFEPISKKIALAVAHTPLWQLIILWGPHLLAGLILVVFILLTTVRPAARLRRFAPPEQTEKARAESRESWMTRFFQKHGSADLLAGILVICGLGLILLPELVYVVDIYSGEYKRANTMFKFTYQAFVLLSLAWAYALVRIPAFWLSRRDQSILQMARAASLAPSDRHARQPQKRKGWPAVVASLGLIVMLLLPGWYPILATHLWLGELSLERYAGLDGMVQMSYKNSDQINGDVSGELAADYAAILWLNENVAGQPVVLEAAGESYTDFCRISAFTGLPTVIGWETHEWLWRTSKSTPDAYGSVVWPRQEDVRELYTTTDQAVRMELLDKYQIAYIVIGDLERNRYSEELSDETRHSLVQEDLLRQLGTVVFEQDSLVILQLGQG